MRKSAIFSTIAAGIMSAAFMATPAKADVCSVDRPYCGGSVYNSTSTDIWITNCWSSGSQWAGDTPPCATNGYSQNRWKAMWYVGRNQHSDNLGRYYWDVDAIQVPQNCRIVISTPGGARAYDRRGMSALWVKITSDVHATITSSSC